MPDEQFLALISGIQQNIGKLLEGQRVAEVSRDDIHRKLDHGDNFTAMLAQQTNELAARVKDIAITLQLGNEVQGQIANRLNKMEPDVEASAKFRIEAMPIISLLKQVRLWAIAAVGLLGIAGTTIGVALANAGPIIKVLFHAWLQTP